MFHNCSIWDHDNNTEQIRDLTQQSPKTVVCILDRDYWASSSCWHAFQGTTEPLIMHTMHSKKRWHQFCFALLKWSKYKLTSLENFAKIWCSWGLNKSTCNLVPMCHSVYNPFKLQQTISNPTNIHKFSVHGIPVYQKLPHSAFNFYWHHLQ